MKRHYLDEINKVEINLSTNETETYPFEADQSTILQIIGDKNTNTNLRYKVGKALNCQSKNCFEITRPKQVGLPCPNVSSSYVFCTSDDFFAYPNNFNHYAQFYRDTFQHGGISLEEMLVPIVTLEPK